MSDSALTFGGRADAPSVVKGVSCEKALLALLAAFVECDKPGTEIREAWAKVGKEMGLAGGTQGQEPPSIAPSALEVARAFTANLDGYRAEGRISDAVFHPEMIARAYIQSESDKDAAYDERNRLVALLASMFPSGVARTDIPGWLPEWHGCVYIDMPCGQASWHYHDSQAHLFAHLPPYTKAWDGHTTEQKYERIQQMARRLPAKGQAHK